MSEVELDPMAILIAVDDAEFAGEVVQVLQACTRFPITLAVTNLLDHALSYLRTTKVDLLLLDAQFAHIPHAVPIHNVRSISAVPVILFAKSLTRDLEQRLKEMGAQAVLPRNVLDPITLVENVRNVFEDHYKKKCSRSSSSSRPITTEQTLAVAEDVDQAILINHSLGANRLKELLSEQSSLERHERTKLRRLLNPKVDRQ